MNSAALIAACDRLLAVEKDVSEMPKEQRDWFIGKEGHRDCFAVARALKAILETRGACVIGL